MILAKVQMLTKVIEHTSLDCCTEDTPDSLLTFSKVLYDQLTKEDKKLYKPHNPALPFTLFIIEDLEKMYPGQDVGSLSNEEIYLLPCCGKFKCKFGKNSIHEAIVGGKFNEFSKVKRIGIYHSVFIICGYLPLAGVPAWKDIHVDAAEAVEKIAAAKNE